MKSFRILFFTLPLFFAFSCSTIKPSTPAMEIKAADRSYPKTDNYLADILASYPQYFDSLLRQKEAYRIQIIFTQINRDKHNRPAVTHHYYNVDPSLYIYPASTVKMPAAALALQKLNELNIKGLDKFSTLHTGRGTAAQTEVKSDPLTADGRPTVAAYIKKIFLVSDNDAYNRLYEFLGQEYLNNSLRQMGLDSVYFLHRLQLALSGEENRTTNPVSFYDAAGRLIYQQPLVRSSLVYPTGKVVMGRGYRSDGKLVHEPFDFSEKNRFSLPDMHTVLQSLVLPETVPTKQRFNLTSDDYRFLRKYMSMLPKESSLVSYKKYPDAYVKFLLYGGDGPIPDSSVRIFNKVGDAYGFLHDVAYIVDFENGVEFMLSATIYCNSDGIFNDDKYEYDTVGFPFLKNLGQVLYQHEKQRTKKYRPDLSSFRFDYSTD